MATTTTKAPTSKCNDTIEAGQTIYKGFERFSCGNCYMLKFQYDGDLVVLQNFEPFAAIWHTNTSDRYVALAVMQDDGRFVIYDRNNKPIWESKWNLEDGTTGAVGVILDDGQFVIKEGSTVRFASNVTGKCATTSAGSTTVTYTTSGKEPCGTFVKYAPNADPTSVQANPDVYGFAAGIDFDNSTQYVGYGKCQGETQQRSGFITTNPADPGARLICDYVPVDFSATKSAYFLLNHNKLMWAQTDRKDMLNQRNVVSIGTDVKFLFGRVFYQGRYRLGLAQLDDFPEFYMADENGKLLYYASDFEILTCSTCANGGAGRFCCLNGKAFGNTFKN